MKISKKIIIIILLVILFLKLNVKTSLNSDYILMSFWAKNWIKGEQFNSREYCKELCNNYHQTKKIDLKKTELTYECYCLVDSPV